MKCFLKTLVLHIFMMRVFGALNWPRRTSSDLPLLLDKIQKEKSFRTLVVYTEDKQQAVGEEVLKNVAHTQILLHLQDLQLPTNATLFNAAINREVLILYCIAEHFQVAMLQRMLQHLGHLRSSRFIFYWQQAYAARIHWSQLQLLFEASQEHFLLNVIAVYADFNHQQIYFSYTQFPKFQVLCKSLQTRCFAKLLGNLQAATITTIPELSAPSIIPYRNAADKLRALGPIARIVMAFADKHNASLKYVLEDQPEWNITATRDIYPMIRNGTVELPMAVYDPSYHFENVQCSKIIAQHTLLPMLPYPALLAPAEIFVILFKTYFTLGTVTLLICFSSLFALEAWLAERGNSLKLIKSIFLLILTSTLRGILAQTMPLQPRPRFTNKLTYALLIVFSIYVSTTITAHLQAYFTSLPREPFITSLPQLLRSSVRIDLPKAVYTFLHRTSGTDFFGDYEQVLNVKDLSVSDWMYSANLKNAQLMDDNMWVIWQRRQERMKRPLFYVPRELSIMRNLPVCLPLYVHCIYREALNTLISQAQDAGLLQHWKRMAYSDLLESGRITASVISEVEDLHILQLEDFYWIAWVYGLGLILALAAFLIELVVAFKRQH